MSVGRFIRFLMAHVCGLHGAWKSLRDWTVEFWVGYRGHGMLKFAMSFRWCKYEAEGGVVPSNPIHGPEDEARGERLVIRDEYRRALDQMDPEKRRAMLVGDWSKPPQECDPCRDYYNHSGDHRLLSADECLACMRRRRRTHAETISSGGDRWQ